MLTLMAAALADLGTFRATYETIHDGHISTLMPLFLSDELNSEWNQRLSAQRLIHTRDLGAIVHQEYALPWPMLPRDLLMRCNRVVDHRAQKVTSTCGSVEHSSAPTTARAVRMEIKRTEWELTPLPGDRTRLRLELELPKRVAIGVPKFVVNYCQRHSLRDSVEALLSTAARLALPSHRAFIGWGRSRAEAAAAGRAAALDDDGAHRAAGGWSSLGVLLTAAALALWSGGALGLNYARGGRSRRMLTPGRAIVADDSCETTRRHRRREQARWRRVRRCAVEALRKVSAQRGIAQASRPLSGS